MPAENLISRLYCKLRWCLLLLSFLKQITSKLAQVVFFFLRYSLLFLTSTTFMRLLLFFFGFPSPWFLLIHWSFFHSELHVPLCILFKYHLLFLLPLWLTPHCVLQPLSPLCCTFHTVFLTDCDGSKMPCLLWSMAVLFLTSNASVLCHPENLSNYVLLLLQNLLF